MQCYKCAKYGHTAKVCRGSDVCFKCAQSHATSSCQSVVMKCVHCKLPHRADFKTCLVRLREEAILSKIAQLKVTRYEAWTMLKGSSSYADKVRESTEPKTHVGGSPMVPLSEAPAVPKRRAGAQSPALSGSRPAEHASPFFTATKRVRLNPRTQQQSVSHAPPVFFSGREPVAGPSKPVYTVRPSGADIPPSSSGQGAPVGDQVVTQLVDSFAFHRHVDELRTLVLTKSPNWVEQATRILSGLIKAQAV